MTNKESRVINALKIVLNVLTCAKDMFSSNKKVTIMITLLVSVLEVIVSSDFDSDELTASCDNFTYSLHNNFETFG